MNLSSRAKTIPTSVTLKLNEQANKLSEAGQRIFNLTAGQLPFKPSELLVESIHSQCNLLKSFQYSPAPGLAGLRKQFIADFEEGRGVNLSESGEEFGCIISNGGKHSIFNLLGALIDPGDEVILLAPYWVSYPEIIKLWGGVPVVVKSGQLDSFTPNIDDIRLAISERTKAIIVNSPNNPTGVHYSDKWMKDFADLLAENERPFIISDEIYFKLNYFDPKPSYFYQHRPELIKRTAVVDGISKSLACTGLRIGYTIAPLGLTQAMGKIQAQTSSGPNSLIQTALENFDFSTIDSYLEPVKGHLRENAKCLQEKLRKGNLSKAWYQTLSAFYFMIDFTQAPVFKKYCQDGTSDCAAEICEQLLQQKGVAIVPSTDFGIPNAARISLVSKAEVFEEAIDLLVDFLNTET